MSLDILILSSRDRGDQTIQEIMQTMSFHQREVSLSTKIEESINYKVILIDQFLNGISSTSFLAELRTTNKTASMYLLSKAAQTLPIGTAYAIWVGIGALGAAIFGIVLFHESVSLLRIGFIAMLFIAILGIKFTSTV